MKDIKKIQYNDLMIMEADNWEAIVIIDKLLFE
jgi:hypothetical protein